MKSMQFQLDFLHHIYNGQRITVLIHQDGLIWFIAKELCDVLEYANSRNAGVRH